MNKTTTIVSLFLCAVIASLSAQVPQLLEHDGYLLESGKPVTGNRTMAIKIYNSATGGNASFSQTIGTVKVTNFLIWFSLGIKILEFINPNAFPKILFTPSG
jgi:hypothetical protein